MPVDKLKQFLEREHAQYVTLPHSPAYTAQEIAANAHVSGKELAKIVVVHLDRRIAMAVLPASQRISLAALSEATGVSEVSFASEAEMRDLFPDCETGAMPPFGNLYGLDVYVSEPLTEDPEIAFNSGSHSELVKMPYGEFDRLVHPKVASLSA